MLFIFWLILIVIIILLVVYYKRAKKFVYETIVMLIGTNGVGKTSTSVSIGLRSIKMAHARWWRRKNIYSKIPLIKKMGMFQYYDEEPKIYCNIPLYENRKKSDKLFKYYEPFTMDILLRKKRMNYKSVILLDEVSLIANSFSGIPNKANPDAKFINEQLQLFIKLIRHELKGTYRGIISNYPNLILCTQSKNDLHFAFDRAISQVIYLSKTRSLPFVKLLWGRDLVLMDSSVVNQIDEDVAVDKSFHFFVLWKSIFNKYDSYCYSHLSDDLAIDDSSPVVINGRFEIATLLNFLEIKLANEKFAKLKKERGL